MYVYVSIIIRVMFICLLTNLSVNLFIYQIYIIKFPFIHPPIHPSIHPSIQPVYNCQSTCRSIYLNLSICLSLRYLHVHICVYVGDCLRSWLHLYLYTELSLYLYLSLFYVFVLISSMRYLYWFSLTRICILNANGSSIRESRVPA